MARNPIWGTLGSPNEQDWLELDLGAPTRFDTAKLYFYDNKQFGSGGNTYRTPSAYTVQVHNGTDWVDVPGQSKSPAAPRANYNKVTFPAVTARRMRVLLTRTGTLAIGVKELQLFDTGSQTQVPGDVGGTVPADAVAHPGHAGELRGVHPGRGARVLGEPRPRT